MFLRKIEMSSDYRIINEEVSRYLLHISLRESDLLKKLREETSKLPRSVMQISPLQGQFMSLILKSIRLNKALEIGVFTGYSSLCIAMALPDNGRLVACDINEEWTAIARRYWKAADVEHKIELRLAPAVDTLNALLDDGQRDSFDFAFIDADKESYEIYYEKTLALLRPGGMMMVDNALWKGYVSDPENTDLETHCIREFNQNRKTDMRVEISLIPVGDGIMLIRKLP
jgi:predicted O-methyltransferase YrrM